MYKIIIINYKNMYNQCKGVSMETKRVPKILYTK